MQTTRLWGLVVGLVLGIVWAWLGFGAVLLTSALGALGWLAGTVIGGAMAGNHSVADLWDELQGRRRAGP